MAMMLQRSSILMLVVTIAQWQLRKKVMHMISLWVPRINSAYCNIFSQPSLLLRTRHRSVSQNDFKFINSSAHVDCNPQSDFPFNIKPNVSVYPPTNLLAMTWRRILRWSRYLPNSSGCISMTHFATAMNRIPGIDLSFVRQRLPSIPQFSAQFRTHVYSVGSSGGTGSGTIVNGCHQIQWLRHSYRICLSLLKSAWCDARGKGESVLDPSLTEKVAGLAARQTLQLQELL